MNAVLPLSFFNRPTLEVAPDLLGKFLVRKKGDELISLMINEVEAYCGEDDLACHARVGKTKRNAALYGPAGHFYMYFVYGMHWMLNIVTEKNGTAGGILIRGAGSISGPARLTKYLELSKEFYGLSASPKNGLWFEDRGTLIDPESIVRTPRIGVGYAHEWAEVPYRFLL